MTPYEALEKTKKLITLATNAGATVEEARSAAFAAVKLISAHKLLDGAASPAPASFASRPSPRPEPPRQSNPPPPASHWSQEPFSGRQEGRSTPPRPNPFSGGGVSGNGMEDLLDQMFGTMWRSAGQPDPPRPRNQEPIQPGDFLQLVVIPVRCARCVFNMNTRTWAWKREVPGTGTYMGWHSHCYDSMRPVPPKAPERPSAKRDVYVVPPVSSPECDHCGLRAAYGEPMWCRMNPPRYWHEGTCYDARKDSI